MHKKYSSTISHYGRTRGPSEKLSGSKIIFLYKMHILALELIPTVNEKVNELKIYNQG